MTVTATTEQDARRRRTVVWVVSLATLGLIFDGYDLVVYGVVVPIFLKDPSQHRGGDARGRGDPGQLCPAGNAVRCPARRKRR